MDNTKNTVVALLLVIALGFGTYFVWKSITKSAENSSGNGVVCTLDAMQCPDGSYVGRSGPNCQFVCPLGTSTQPTRNQVILQSAIGQLASGLGVQVTPLEVAEDSRCPYNVQCIQAGTVRVRVLLVSGLGESPTLFTLNEPITTEAETVTLIAVTPTKEEGKVIAPSDYRFTFKVAKR